MLPETTAAGGALVVISPQMEKLPREGDGQTPLPFTLLRDHGNTVGRTYGLVFTLP